jgi:predicted acyltransferase
MNQSIGSQRLESIDILRGFDMFWIIGGTEIFFGLAKATNWGILKAFEPQFHHVPWEGFHFEDLIMPLFIFIVGVVMPFSFGKRLQSGTSKQSLYIHVIRRSVILFILGMATQGNLLFYNWQKLYIFVGVLPAIGAGYFVASLIMLNFNLRWQIGATALLLLVYWALMTLVPVPGHGAGVLTPTGNLAYYLDHLIMQGFTPADRVYTEIVNITTFGATVMLGVFGGYVLQSNKNSKDKLLWLTGLGVSTFALGFIWGRWFPIVKHIWSSSFVLFSGGLCFLLLALFYLVIDVWGFKKWGFIFKVIGMNSIAVYVATHVFDFRLIGNVFVGGLRACNMVVMNRFDHPVPFSQADRLGMWGDFIQEFAAFTVVWLIIYYMYRKKTFVKI